MRHGRFRLVVLGACAALASGASAQEKIQGPWLWMMAPCAAGAGGAACTDIDSLDEATKGKVKEQTIADKGAKEGDKVGDKAWKAGKISPVGGNNVNAVMNALGLGVGDINDHSSYAWINVVSKTAQRGVTMRVGSDDSIKVWLNGKVVHKNPVNRGAGDFQDTFTVDLKAGNNSLLVKVSERGGGWSMFVGIDAKVDFDLKQPGVQAVEARGKLATSWAAMKSR
jgi:hypothetical protein